MFRGPRTVDWQNFKQRRMVFHWAIWYNCSVPFIFYGDSDCRERVGTIQGLFKLVDQYIVHSAFWSKSHSKQQHLTPSCVNSLFFQSTFLYLSNKMTKRRVSLGQINLKWGPKSACFLFARCSFCLSGSHWSLSFRHLKVCCVWKLYRAHS